MVRRSAEGARRRRRSYAEGFAPVDVRRLRITRHGDRHGRRPTASELSARCGSAAGPRARRRARPGRARRSCRSRQPRRYAPRGACAARRRLARARRGRPCARRRGARGRRRRRRPRRPRCGARARAWLRDACPERARCSARQAAARAAADAPGADRAAAPRLPLGPRADGRLDRAAHRRGGLRGRRRRAGGRARAEAGRRARRPAVPDDLPGAAAATSGARATWADVAAA